MAAPSFKLIIRFEQSILPYLHDKKIRLCSAFGVTTNLTDEVYNVIATSDEPAKEVVLEWTEAYQLAACNHAVQDGNIVTPNTDPRDVLPGAALVLDASWTDPIPAPSTTTLAGPAGGFLLLSRPDSVAVLLKRVRGAFVPVYVTSTGPHIPPPSRQIMRPNGMVVVFLMRAPAGAVFDLREAISELCEVRYEDELKREGGREGEGVVEYAAGEWRVSNEERGGG